MYSNGENSERNSSARGRRDSDTMLRSLYAVEDSRVSRNEVRIIDILPRIRFSKTEYSDETSSEPDENF